MKKRISPKERAAMKNATNESPTRVVNPQRSPVRASAQKPASPKKVDRGINISPARGSVRMSIIGIKP